MAAAPPPPVVTTSVVVVVEEEVEEEMGGCIGEYTEEATMFGWTIIAVSESSMGAASAPRMPPPLPSALFL
jgi:hypothetical protein